MKNVTKTVTTESKGTAPAAASLNPAEENRIDLPILSVMGASGKITKELWDSSEGELFAGLNIITLEVDQVDGPFVFVRLNDPVQLKEEFEGRVEVGVCYRVTPDGKPHGGEIQMPASASMSGKILDAKMAPGDIFGIKRLPNYDSKRRKDCKAWALKIFRRSNNPPVVSKITAEEREAKGAKKKGRK
jgi:hypothetical protein